MMEDEAGYCICLCAHADGSFTVSGPEPLSDEQKEGEPEGQAFPDLATALKSLVQMVKANPVTQDGEAQFKAGYENE